MTGHCPHKHAKPQIADADWRCPKCGITADDPSGGFIIGDPLEGSDDCELLHDDDGLYCEGCGYGVSGKTFAKRVAVQKSLVKCEHCKGSGYVKATA